MQPRASEAALSTPPVFRDIFRRGSATRSGPVTLWSLRTRAGVRRAGVIARASHGRLKSHDRQRARRLLREVIRRAQHQLPPSVDLILMLTCPGHGVPTFHEVRTAVLTACATQHLLVASR